MEFHWSYISIQFYFIFFNFPDENSSLLRQHRKGGKATAMKSNFKSDDLNTSNATTASSSSGSSGGKSVKWANNIQTTQV